jgi:hypothetical protein
MLGLPFRIISTIAIALFFSSRWVRRAVAAVVVSAVIVAGQHHEVGEWAQAPVDDDRASARLEHRRAQHCQRR